MKFVKFLHNKKYIVLKLLLNMSSFDAKIKELCRPF